MFTFKHIHTRPKIKAGDPLAGKKLYFPVMAEGMSEVIAAIFRWMGVETCVTPRSDKRTLELGGKFTNGDECYPAKIVLGDFLRAIEAPGFDPKRAVFVLPTTDGPCRFGQYVPLFRRILREIGYHDIPILSPTDETGYSDFGKSATRFVRTAWRAVVASDVLRRCLLKTRPYETAPGAADEAFRASLEDLCETIESSCADADCQIRTLVECLTRARDRFRSVPARYDTSFPLIGVVGEIFCRLNAFSNEDLIRRLENHGAEISLSHVSEWVAYTNEHQAQRLRLNRQMFSLELLGEKVRSHFQHYDQRMLLAPFAEDFEGYEEPEIPEVLKLAEPYLPARGVIGEMLVSVGTAAYWAKHGADGIIDISPFTCMNGIVSEAIYPKLSSDLGGIPIRSFYFDGTQSDLDRDLGIYLELARSYRERKPYPRRYPSHFKTQAAFGRHDAAWHGADRRGNSSEGMGYRGLSRDWRLVHEFLRRGAARSRPRCSWVLKRITPRSRRAGRSAL
jgi:predicted nucleotide-binding protein (sugar kinase/HSP70/actin superfamily)